MALLNAPVVAGVRKRLESVWRHGMGTMLVRSSGKYRCSLCSVNIQSRQLTVLVQTERAAAFGSSAIVDVLYSQHIAGTTG